MKNAPVFLLLYFYFFFKINFKNITIYRKITKKNEAFDEHLKTMMSDVKKIYITIYIKRRFLYLEICFKKQTFSP